MASDDTATRRRASTSDDSSADIEKQVAQLQADLKAIGATLARMGAERAGEAQGMAAREYRNLAAAGQHALEGVTDEFGAVEKQLKDTIRTRPFMAVLGAVGIGYLLAILNR